MDLFEDEQKILTDAMDLIHKAQAGATLSLDDYQLLVQKYGQVLKQLRRSTRFSDQGSILHMKLEEALEQAEKRERDLKRAREINELQLAKLNLATKTAKIGLWEMAIVRADLSNNENVFMWSDEFRVMLGFIDEQDFPNVFSSWSDCLHPEDKDRTLECLKNHLLDTTGKTPYDIEYRLRKKDGEYQYFWACGEAIRDEEGNAIKVVGSLMDMTETKNVLLDTRRQKVEAEAANKAKSTFLSVMSHEIRTPLNVIRGITEIQLQDEHITQENKDAFHKIGSASDMLLSIIDDILDLSKIESNKMDLMIEQYEVAGLIRDSVQMNVMRFDGKPITFKLYIDETLPYYLLGDELRIKQILNNLLSNAFKYTESGTINLSIFKLEYNQDDEIKLVLKVSDTGQGMTQEQIDLLFDEYSRFNYAANRKTVGTGLGMNITRNLIRLMDGEIFVESEPDHGSTFTVYLPQKTVNDAILGKELAQDIQNFHTSQALKKRVSINREPMPYGNVLIVDDMIVNIDVAKGLLTLYQLNIDTANSAFEAIEKIRSGNTYDIIFMDHMMPIMDGIEATETIRASGYELPIVALTANAVAGQAEMFLEHGFNDFISKPINVHKLDYLLNNLIKDKYKKT